uniref:homoserine dehydrogenase n=1 Tax=candidate division WOR-3 bacterium TaxID=2052148 RepID=A0A7C4TBR4_UNCW3
MSDRIHTYNIGLLGFGKVLRSFVKYYLRNKQKIIKEFGFELRFCALADSESSVAGDINIHKFLYIKEKRGRLGNINKNPLEIFMPLIKTQKLDIIIDGLPGLRNEAGVSFPFIIESLKNGVNVICVNKSPLVFKGDEIFQLARKNKVYIGLNATTGSALPVSGIINNELISARIYKIRGVLNGTSNYVLDKIMFESKHRVEAIQEAIKMGIAEPDYRYDLEGIDTCFKTVIIGLLLTGKCADLKSIPCCGIMKLDDKEINFNVKRGKVVRLIGNLSIKSGQPLVSVGPEFIDRNDPLYVVSGANKGITFYTKGMGELTLIGGASGLDAVGATIMKDIINFHKGNK